MLRANGLFSSPEVIHARDAGDLFVREFTVGAVHHAAELAGVYEEYVAAAVAEAAVLLVARQEPQACRDLRRVEELARQRDHAVYQVGLNEVLADLAFA